MTPGALRVLACVLTLPLAVFVTNAVASPEPVDPDRSRPLIIGQVSDRQPTDLRTQDPPRNHEPAREKSPAPEGGTHGPGSGVASPSDDAGTGQRYSVVVPPPRDLSDDDSGFDDDVDPTDDDDHDDPDDHDSDDDDSDDQDSGDDDDDDRGHSDD